MMILYLYPISLKNHLYIDLITAPYRLYPIDLVSANRILAYKIVRYKTVKIIHINNGDGEAVIVNVLIA